MKNNIIQELKFNEQESKYNIEKENLDAHKTVFCPAQGTYSMDDLK
jgi:hypothetical protein